MSTHTLQMSCCIFTFSVRRPDNKRNGAEVGNLKFLRRYDFVKADALMPMSVVFNHPTRFLSIVFSCYLILTLPQKWRIVNSHLLQNRFDGYLWPPLISITRPGKSRRGTKKASQNLLNKKGCAQTHNQGLR